MATKRRLPDKLFTLKECDIQKACEDLLQWDGWRIFRLEQNWSEKKCKDVGEAGAPDCLAIRYVGESMAPTGMRLDTNLQALSQVLMVEWKRPGGKAAQRQSDWHLLERKRGALVWLAGVEFPASVDGFLAHYRASGLNRRPI